MYVWMALMSMAMIAAPMADAQTSRTGSGSAHRTTTGTSTTRTSRTTATKSSATNSARPASGTRPASTTVRPASSTTTTRPGSSTPRPGNTTTTRPGNGSTRPGSSTPRPGNTTTTRPGSSLPRPGSGSNNGVRPGNSVPRPGTGGRPASRPTPPPRPAYRPPVSYRWERPLPPPPPRYNYIRVGVPSIGSVLGLAFGSLIDYSIGSLINSGYTITSTYGGNTVYLSNVAQYGVTWPEATLFYVDGGLSGARFQYGSYSPTDYRFMTAYRQLCATYGDPVSYTNNYGYPVATWWGGNNTGYITLQYGPGVTNTGATMYYTDLIYGN